jgi:hypothetical protein
MGARPAYPSIFSFSTTGSTGTFTDICGIQTFTAPKFTKGTADVSEMNSTYYYEDLISAGPVRTGSLGVDVVYLSTNSQHTSLIQEAMNNGTKVGWKITFAGTSSNHIGYGDALITGYGIGDLTQDGKLTARFDMKITGKPTWPVSSTT